MEPRFNEEDSARILARAAELQFQADQKTKVSLDELQRAAAEAGIDPLFVQIAASESVRSPKFRWGASFNARFAVVFAFLQICGIGSLAALHPALWSASLLLCAPVLLGFATGRLKKDPRLAMGLYLAVTLIGTVLLVEMGQFPHWFNNVSLGGDLWPVLVTQMVVLAVSWVSGLLFQLATRTLEAAKRPSRI
ncbi:hypothetical protein BH11ARM2_BH11ARM2_04200 [soil metagenome]